MMIEVVHGRDLARTGRRREVNAKHSTGAAGAATPVVQIRTAARLATRRGAAYGGESVVGPEVERLVVVVGRRRSK